MDLPHLCESLVGSGLPVEWIYGACLNFLNLASMHSVISTINFEIAISTSRLMRKYLELKLIYN